MAAFLFKTEPGEYSYADLARDKRVVWEGVSNATALIHLRQVRKGDTVVIYHTGDERAAVALASAASDPYPDPKLRDPKRVVVDLVPDRSFAVPVPLTTFKSDPAFADFALVKISRLSVMPVSSAQLKRLLSLAR